MCYVQFSAINNVCKELLFHFYLHMHVHEVIYFIYAHSLMATCKHHSVPVFYLLLVHGLTGHACKIILAFVQWLFQIVPQGNVFPIVILLPEYYFYNIFGKKNTYCRIFYSCTEYFGSTNCLNPSSAIILSF